MSQIRKPGPPWVVLCPRQGCWEQTISGASPLLRSHFQTCHTHRFPVGSNIRQTLIKAVAIDSLVRSMATGKGSPVQRQSAGVTRHFRGSGGGGGGDEPGLQQRQVRSLALTCRSKRLCDRRWWYRCPWGRRERGVTAWDVCVPEAQLSGPGEGLLGRGRCIEGERGFIELSEVTAWGQGSSAGEGVCLAPGSGWNTQQFSWQPCAFSGWYFTRGRGHRRHGLHG